MVVGMGVDYLQQQNQVVSELNRNNWEAMYRNRMEHGQAGNPYDEFARNQTEAYENSPAHIARSMWDAQNPNALQQQQAPPARPQASPPRYSPTSHVPTQNYTYPLSHQPPYQDYGLSPAGSQPLANTAVANQSLPRPPRAYANPLPGSASGGAGVSPFFGGDPSWDAVHQAMRNASRTIKSTPASTMQPAPTVPLAQPNQVNQASNQPLPASIYQPPHWLPSGGPVTLAPEAPTQSWVG